MNDKLKVTDKERREVCDLLLLTRTEIHGLNHAPEAPDWTPPRSAVGHQCERCAVG